MATTRLLDEHLGAVRDGVYKGLAGMGGEVTTGVAIGYPASSMSLVGGRATGAPYVAGPAGPCRTESAGRTRP